MYLTEIICDLLGCINLGRQHYCCWLHTRLLYPGERSGLMWNQLPLSKATSLSARELRISSTKTLFPTLHKSLFCICLALISLRSAQPMGLPPALEVERNKYCSWPVDYAIKLLDISEKRGVLPPALGEEMGKPPCLVCWMEAPSSTPTWYWKAMNMGAGGLFRR